MTDTVLNTRPIYSAAPIISWGTVATANTAKDGTGTVVTVFTADATNGGRVEKLKVRAQGTAVGTVLRIYINNGSTNTTATNNSLYYEVTAAASAVSETTAQSDIEVLLNLSLPPGYKINVTVGTTIAAALSVTAVGGKY
jgi:hypothetical protein